MRRIIKIVAGAAIIAAATASGASAIQVIPKAGGITARFPIQPYISDNDQVTRGNPTGGVTVHGSCFGARDVAAGDNLTTHNPSIPVVPTHTLLGEYPYGATTPGLVNVTSAPAVNPAFASGFLGTTNALAFGPGIVVTGAADTNHRATLQPVPTPGTPLVSYRGEVEYLVYSDSYSTGPIDLDLAPINSDGSFDIRLNTAGLGVDTYAIRFLGCRNVAATVNAFERAWRINYYQGTPSPLSCSPAPAEQYYVATTYNCASSATNSTSYIPTNILPPGGGSAGQIQLGFDTYRCQYAAGVANNGPGTYLVTPVLVANQTGQVSGRGPNERSAPDGSFLGADNFTCGSYSFAIPRGVLPITSGYNGNGDVACTNRYNNNQQFAGSQYSASPNNINGTNTNVVNVDPLFDPVIGSTGGATGGGTTNGTFGCPSGYDPVGIRANSIYDYYARFQVVGGGANINVPTNAAAFVAPANSQSASAGQQATAAVITAAGGTPAAITTANASTQASAQTSASAATPAAASTQTAAVATPVAAAVVTPAGPVVVNTPAVAAPKAETVVAPAPKVSTLVAPVAKKVAPKASVTKKAVAVKVVAKAPAKVVAKAPAKVVAKAPAKVVAKPVVKATK